MTIDLTVVPMIPRPQMFADALARATADLKRNPNIYHRGPRASGMSYCDGIDRKRVRALARDVARAEMRQLRKAK